MVDRRRDVKTITLQRRHDVMCLLGKELKITFLMKSVINIAALKRALDF